MIPLHDDNPSDSTPIFTVAFIAICVLVFLWQVTLPGPAAQSAILGFGVVPKTLLGGGSLPPDLYRIPAWLTILSSMFMHGGWMHLIGNMLYLWIFGNNVEDAMGHARFVLFYVLCGIAAALAQALPDPNSTVPMIGASGAISGVLGAYLLLYPHARVLVLIPLGIVARTFRVPAMVVLGFWFGLQLLSSFAGSSDGVAFRAHVGGFIAGLVLIPLIKRNGVPLFARPR
jgi:membrane associated rhomboid family serine protease